MASVLLPSTKAKEAYAVFFDSVFIEGALGKTAFVNSNPQSKYKLGTLAGLVIYLAPNEIVGLSVNIPKSPDAIVAFTFTAQPSGSRVTVDTINFPEGSAGDTRRKSIDSILAAYAARFGGKIEVEKKKGKK